ncbi:MAG: putative glycolipid-binding domain-containing protein, partial [Acetobacteraceae bacterium]|nr:putative glycolipid-binding domain-containing protein [Acetobacteraceae bacterium]
MLWRRLDRPGHDAARLSRHDEGWLLRGAAVFLDQTGPACIEYEVSLDASWRTTGGKVGGFFAGKSIKHVITRRPDGWLLDGVVATGTGGLLDLDYGFTPATNLLQLRRLDLRIGKAA